LETAAHQAQDPPRKKYEEPFAFADWSWLNGNARTKELAMDTPLFTPEIRFDVNYTSSFNHRRTTQSVAPARYFARVKCN